MASSAKRSFAGRGPRNTAARVAAVYRDAHTGTEADRPEWERMILDIGQTASQVQPGEGVGSTKVETVVPIQPATVIVIESLDRLARDVIIQSVLIKRCIDAGVLLFRRQHRRERVRCLPVRSDPQGIAPNPGCVQSAWKKSGW